MQVQTMIENTLNEALTPAYLLVENESHQHNVAPGSESHFKVTVVCEAFNGQRLLARHRTINGLLAEALAGPVHALALHTYTPDEWVARGGEVLASPQCMGGSKR